MSDTIFDKIVREEIPCWKIMENDSFLAFLTPFGNTPGNTVVIPKTNLGAYAFDLPNTAYQELMLFAKEVSIVLEMAFKTKIALVIEGTAIPYVHVKLFPMHGVFDVSDNEHATETVFFEKYPGYINTQSGPKISDEELKRIQTLITSQL